MENNSFDNLKSLSDRIRKNKFLVITYRNLEGYDGMVLCIAFRFDKKTSKFQLDIQFECLGLDFYGDTLQESYVYEFENIENLLKYTGSKYAIRFEDIPVKFSFDHTQFPHVLKDGGKRPQFEIAWKKFQEDFKAGVFLEKSLKLVYSSIADRK